MIARSPALVANCERYYSTKCDCKGCPITSACWDGPVGTLSLERIEAHIVRMNEAAACIAQPDLFAEARGEG